jgi:type IV secretion system protein VirB11
VSSSDHDVLLRTYLEPLRRFLDDPTVTEVCVNRPGEVFTESSRGWERFDVEELSFGHGMSLSKTIATSAKQRLTESDNMLSAALPTGERCQIVVPPSCPAGTVSMTIRKPSLRTLGLEEFEEQGTFTECRTASDELSQTERELLHLKERGSWRTFIELAVTSRQNIIISGATGSGKTTFTRGIISAIPRDERLITIEDTHELWLPNHANHVHLFYSKDQQGISHTTPKKLLESCLRMKPSRVLLAELRGDEAYYYLRNIGSGHPGSITTIHANSAGQAFEQLTLLIKESAAGATLDRTDIRSLLTMLVDVVIQFKVVNGRRKMTEVYYEPQRKRDALKKGW